VRNHLECYTIMLMGQRCPHLLRVDSSEFIHIDFLVAAPAKLNVNIPIGDLIKVMTKLGVPN